MYNIQLSKNAAKLYENADEEVVIRLNNAFSVITTNPYIGNNIKKLKGEYKGLFRYRTGSYRIVYSVEESIKIISIIWIGQRKDAY